MKQIKYGAGQILNETTLNRSQIFAVLDGVLPQSIGIEDEDGTEEAYVPNEQLENSILTTAPSVDNRRETLIPNLLADEPDVGGSPL